MGRYFDSVVGLGKGGRAPAFHPAEGGGRTAPSGGIDRAPAVVKRFAAGVAALFCLALLSGCATSANADIKEKNMLNGMDKSYVKTDGAERIYLSGGCFWGMEKLAEALPGVSSAVSGYANGSTDSPSYEMVCRGGTGFKETVRVEYDPTQITLEQILSAYFLVIDPTVENRQGNDRGAQYQTGIYYADEASKTIVERIVAQEAKRYDVFKVEHGPLINFYDAEAYHQDYLAKNPGGYCHIPKAEMDAVAAIIRAERAYQKPPEDELRSSLTERQYEITQNAGTERAFTGEYWDNHGAGIYVDITTGQPLFSSCDKYDSGCGWPSFTAPILAGSVQYRKDGSHGMRRTELTAANGDTHLGHLFEGDRESPNGMRYCINSASLRFVPVDRMAEAGYGAYLMLFE